MTRQVTDNLYIDLEYFTPEEYYTYEAIASANASASAELSADISVIRQGASTQSVTASFTATISHIEGVDLVLNNFASFDLVPSVIREVATDIDSAFTAVAVTVAGNVQNASASFSAEFAQTVIVERIAGSASTQSSSFTLSVDAQANRSADIALDTIGNLLAQADRSRGYSSDLASAFTVTAESNPIIEFDAFLEYQIPDLFVDAEKTAQGVITAGALFTPSITADAFKNHTAILETAATQTADVTFIASATSTQSSAFAQLATATKAVSAEISLVGAFVQTASAIRIRPGVATISCVATTSATANRVSRAGIEFALSTAGQITTAQSKFGGGSLGVVSGQSGQLMASVSPHLQADLGSFNWTHDHWLRQTNTAPGSMFTILQLAPTGINIRVGYQYDGTTHIFRIQYTGSGGSTFTVTTTSPVTVPLNQFNHYRITGQVFSSQTTILTLWLNGSRILQASAQYLPGSTSSLRYFGVNGHNIDEIRLYNGNLTDKDTTSFSVPTAAFVNDNNTRYLLHLDTNVLDDNLLTVRSGTGALSTAATISATANKIVKGNSTQSSSFAQSAQATVTKAGVSNMAANGFVMTTAGYLIDDVADLIYSIDMSVLGNFIASAESAQTTTTSLSATGGFLKSADSSIASESALSASLGTIRTTTVTIDSAVTATADADRLRGVNADLASEGFVLAIGGEQQNVTADLTSTAELSAVIGVIKQFNSTQSSAFALAANAGFVSSADADIAAESSVTVNNFRVRFADIVASSEFSQTADINFVADHSTAISTSSELQAQGNLIRDHAALFNAAMSLQAQGNYTLSSAASADANADLQAINNYTADGSANFESVGFAISVVAKTGLGAADLTAVSTMTVQGNAILAHSASVTSSSAMTTTGTRIFEFAIGNYNVQGVDFRPGFSPFLRGTTAAGNYGAWVMSFYAADAQGTLFDGDAFTNEPTGYSDKSTVTIGNSAVRYSVPYDGYVQWDISDLDLSGYHHYLLRVNTAESTNSLKYQLFIDGEPVTGVTVYKTNTSEPSPPNYQIVTAPTNFPIELASDINLGVNTWNRSSGEGIDFSKFSGGFTQWYFDYTNSYTAGTYPTQNTLYREQFFDGGYVDMGADGRDSGLSEPRHFLELLDFTSTTNIPDQGSSNSNWRWKTLADNPVIVGSDVIDYTASATDNSTQAILGPVRGKFSLSATGRNIQVVSAQMPAVFTQVTGARKTVQGNISLNSAVSTQVQASSTKTFDIAIQSTATLAANTSNTVLATVNLVSTVNLTADGIIVSGAIANLNSTATLSANAGLLAEGSATIASESALSIQADRIKDAFLAVDSNCEVQATAIKTASAQGSLANTATLAVTADRIPAFRIDLESNFAVTASAVKTTSTNSVQSAQFTATTTPRKLVGVSAVFTAFYTQLTVGRVISLDPYTTYIVPAETRLYQIHRETRLYSIEPENRSYKIRKESRLYTIDSETRIYNIKG